MTVTVALLERPYRWSTFQRLCTGLASSAVLAYLSGGANRSIGFIDRYPSLTEPEASRS